MKPFHTIAVPHDDILQGRLTLDVFAADLWEVYQKRGPEEYRDADLFFKKTYPTAGLKHLFAVVEKRLKGNGGDPIIQMQTPFGGGKTHSLIALYHKTHEWGVKTAVIVGTKHNAEKDTLWGLLAEQLNGMRFGFEGQSAPGSEALQRLLGDHQPLLILMDEVLEYVVKASAVTVGESTLAAQTLAFMQELTEAVAIQDRVALVVTLPSSTLEHYNEHGERLFEQLQKISGRVEKIFTPVKDEEVGAIIRRRLFSGVDEKAATEVINTYIEQAEQEALLSREESITYRARFKQTYPFLPEVVDVLYKRWGSFPNFQRTRGTLRLLGLVLHALKNAQRPYITLADFPLQEDEIRRELLKHIGNEHDSVLAADLISPEAGAHKANHEIGKAYQGLGLGERVATTIFLHSFVGGKGEAGATPNEVKRHTLTPGLPASVIAEVLSKLSSRLLFYLHKKDEIYYFSTTANLNRALTIRMENLTASDLKDAERELLGSVVGQKGFKIYLWPEQPADIPDTPDLKLILLQEANSASVYRFLSEKGQTPRVNRNTLCFVSALPNERTTFETVLRRYLATESLLNDPTLALTETQRQELRKQGQKLKTDLQDHIRKLYRQIFLPLANGVTNEDMGLPTYASGRRLDDDVYEWLRGNGRLVEKLAPLVIKERYLQNKDYVFTCQLVENSWRTPGEILVKDRGVWEAGIAEGVRNGFFGLGELDENEQPRCKYYKEEPSISLAGREILISAQLCEGQRGGGIPAIYTPTDQSKENESNEPKPGGLYGGGTINTPILDKPVPDSNPSGKLKMKFQLQKGQLSNLYNLLAFLQQRFNQIDFDITFSQGSITQEEVTDKIEETFNQLGIEANIENLRE